MNFISFAFVLLFLPVALARATIGRNGTEPLYRGIVLFASTIFVMWHVPIYLLIMLTSIGSDFLAAWLMSKPHESGLNRRVLLISSLAVNLLLLAVFKYTSFAIACFEDFSRCFGSNVVLPHPEILLPMGISFYTFGSMSYTVDVFRQQMPAVKRFRDFYFFVTFFPHMVAGPIIRAENFFLQFGRRRRINWRAFNEGAYLVILGLFLKMVCADNIASFVNFHWKQSYQDSSTTRLGLAFLFSMQIYCDFDGYSNIARGLAYWLGFRFPVNFNNPYLANSFKNFWERWHITLSTWLRDYLYIPLGGNRGTNLRTCYNLMIVMLLGGLWHGASLTFVVWGGIHGTALVFERILGMNMPYKKPLFVRMLWYLFVQLVILVSWIFFRSQSLAEASSFLLTLTSGHFAAPRLWLLVALVYTLPPVLFHLWGVFKEKKLVQPESSLFKAVAAAVMLYAVMSCYGSSSDFIYFQF